MKKLSLLVALVICLSITLTSCVGPMVFTWMYNSWIIGLDAEDVEYIRVSHQYIGVAPGSFITHYYIEDPEEIEKYLIGLSWVRHYGNILMTDGGGSSAASVVLKDGTRHGVSTSGVSRINGSAYRAIGAPDFDRKKARITSSFLTYGRRGEVYLLDEMGAVQTELLGIGFDIAALEFAECEPSKYDGVIPTHAIRTSFGDLYILSEKAFYIDFSYYKDMVFELTEGSFYEMIEKLP